jgi:DNA-binding NarL/FixJ family response regulator
VAPEDSAGTSGTVQATTRSADLAAAREAYGRRDWVAARARFAARHEESPLDADDLYALANCFWWLGDLDHALPTMREAHLRYLDEDRPGPAALAAVDLGYTLALRGDVAQGSGWTGRARRLLQALPEGVEHGYLVYLDFETAFAADEHGAALDLARQVHDAGRRYQDPTLVALGVVGQGRVVLRQGDVATGMAMLDEAMVAALSDELDPAFAGNIYCQLMSAAVEIADLRRAGEWTQATAEWCERMPGAGPFMGICRVHRAQVLQVCGDWERAEREALRVCRDLAHFDVSAVAAAQYLVGDLRRLRGDWAAAEEAFDAAHRLGRDPQPGLALLRLDQGHADVAAASIRTALAAAGDNRVARGQLLPAAVEIAVANEDIATARQAGEELADLAATYASVGFTGAALHARGVVLLAEGEPEQALPVLRDALRSWQQVDAHYEVARVRLTLARACDALGDQDAAERERAAARAKLGATFPAPGARTRPGGLTEREAEILALVAGGRTNQQIAADLVLSIRTVERHLATVYQKLGVGGRSARAAAVSFALREGLLPPG